MGGRKNFSWMPLFDDLKKVGDSFEVSKRADTSQSLTEMIGTIYGSFRHYRKRNGNSDHVIFVQRMDGAKLKVTRIQ